MPKKSTKRTHLRTTEETRYNICEDYFARFMTVKKICQKYRMADTTVRGILERNRVEDRIAYKSRGGARNTTQFKQEHTHFIRDMMDMEDEQNIVSLEEIQKKLLERFPNDFFVASSSSSSASSASSASSSSSASVTPTLSALQRHIDKNLQLTMKRVMSPLPADVNISHIHQQRLAYCNHLQANQFDYLTNCIFIGESEFNVCMVPARLRLKRGKKSDAMLSKTRRGKTISILGAISSNRIECLQAIVVDRPSDQAMYEDFMTEYYFNNTSSLYPFTAL
ncbi:uncharacterized protein BX663DRAFT_504325 [Cokeromyces recurvatus]|uniref:uncharacterized protein n=1 Tax=Cokeromyces recurvatus TaxID=90255 RepID=UPI00221FC656|nr:uncharacterized protein BX663DRAFT_504325 [Cokeromyces recurvatus]KAI7904217.1 hypothetical protein BX663DRAFT_504325 [Cokeromyces recurvatus]